MTKKMVKAFLPHDQHSPSKSAADSARKPVGSPANMDQTS